MANFNIAKLQKAYVKGGKTLVKSNLEFVASHGIIAITDPSSMGIKTGEYGKFLQLRTAENNLMFISLEKGCPPSANKFEIKEYVATADYEKMKEGDVIFRAIAVVEEEEE